MNKEPAIDILILKTSLFGDATELLDSLTSVEGAQTHLLELDPEQMADTDWDNVIQHSLQAKKVVTL